MTAREIIKELIKTRNWSQSKLAEEAGLKSQSNVTGMLNRSSSLRVDNLVKLVEAMGYEVIIRDKMGSNKEWRIKK